MPDDKPGLQPLPLTPINGPANAQARVSAPPITSLDDKLDDWMSAHPDDTSFADAPAQPATEPVAPPQAADAGGQPPTPAPTDTQAQQPPPQDQIPQPPPTEPQAQQPPAPQAQAPPQPTEPPKPTAPAEPVRFSLDSRYVFSEGGPAWTGQQVVDGLRERQELIPKAQEAAQYEAVFKMPAAQAKELWEPNLNWLREPRHQPQLQMIASMMADEQKAIYLARCSDHYDQEAVQQPQQFGPQAQPQQQRLDPAVERRLDMLEKRYQEAETERLIAIATNEINRDMEAAAQRYPQIRANVGLRNAIIASADFIKRNHDPENRLGTGVAAALEWNRALIESVGQVAALDNAAQIAREAAQPPPPPPPPLIGSGGASPQPTLARNAALPKDFPNLDDAVDEWMKNPPPQFR